MIPTETMSALYETWDSITALGETLTENDWKTQTDCPGWTVQDNLSHMIGTERMLHGFPATQHKANKVDHVKNPIGSFNENEVDERRHRDGVEVLNEWKELVTLRKAMLDSADDAYFDHEMITPTGPGTMADFLHMRVMDCWVHEQDMRRAIDQPGHNTGDAAELSIGRLLRTLPIVVGKRAQAPDDESVIIHITGPIRRLIPITVEGGRANFVSGLPTNPLVMIDIDSDNFVRLATGRCTADQIADAITIVGDVGLGRRIVDNCNMMI